MMQATQQLIKAFEKFNNDLIAFGEETSEELVTLYEDAYTTRRVAKFRLYKNGKLTWVEVDDNGVARAESYSHYDNDDVRDTLSFWRANLRRAKKYWAMDADTLDKIQEGEIEDTDEE